MVINYIYNFISQILTLIVPLITAPYLARVLRESGNGQIAFVNSLVVYFVAFAGFGFSIYGQREVAKYQNDNHQRIKVLIEIQILKLFFTVSALILYMIFINLQFALLDYKLLLYIASIQIVSVLFDVQFYYQGIEDFKSIALRTIIFRLISVIAVFIFIRSENDVAIYIFIYSLSNLIANFYLWPRLIKETKLFKYKINKLELKRHFMPSFHIFLPVLSGTILSVLDSTMIGYLASNSEYQNGCYGTALKLINTIVLVVIVDTQVLASRNSNEYYRGNYRGIINNLKFGFHYVWILAFPIMIGLFILSYNISAWFCGPGYDIVPLILQIFAFRVFNQGVMYVIANQYLIQINKETVCSKIYFLGIIFNIILNSLLIPKFGAIGASIASVISETIMNIILIQAFRKDGIFWNRELISPIPKYLLSSIIMGIPLYFMNLRMSRTFLSFCILTAVGGVTYILVLILFKDNFILFIIKQIKNYFLDNKENCK